MRTEADREECRRWQARCNVQNDTPIAFRLLLKLLIDKGVISQEEWNERVDDEAARWRADQEMVNKILGEIRNRPRM